LDFRYRAKPIDKNAPVPPTVLQKVAPKKKKPVS
jgi:hypothetical protein